MNQFVSSTKFKSAYWFLWLFSIGILLYLWPSFKFGKAIWQADGSQHFPQIFLILVPWVVGTVVALRGRSDSATYWIILLLNGSIYGLIFLILFQIRHPFSRFVLPLTFLGSVSLQIIGAFCFLRCPPKGSTKLIQATTVCSVLMLGVVAYNPAQILRTSFLLLGGTPGSLDYSVAAQGPASREERYLNTAFYDVRADVYHSYLPVPEVRGGGMVVLEEGVLLVTGEGDFYLLNRIDPSGDLEVVPLQIQVPINFDDFVSAAPVNVFPQWFRVAGIQYRRTDSGIRLWISHHYWKGDTKRYVVRVSTIEGSLDAFKTGASNLKWSTIYESSPGMDFMKDSRNGNGFGGLQIGGRMQFLDDATLLLTVGDHEFDGWVTELSYSQDRNAAYGKVMKLNLGTGESDIFTVGNRNPQGLLIAKDGTIWSTEHGPQGGDELNILVEDQNYGWPLVTLGTEYEEKIWPLSNQQGSHKGYQSPVFAWTPSIGISNLIELTGKRFPIWKDDLMIAAMEQESLYRVTLDGHRVLVVEPVPVGDRIRDIVEDASGQIYLWADSGNIILLSPILGEEKTGEMLLAQCTACHTMDDTGKHSIGPNLGGFFGKPIAQAKNFPYSPALKNLQGLWDAETLNTFLENPQQFAPGTTMAYSGLKKESDRQKVLDYLQGL